MTNNKRDLTAYVRYDATNRVVAGSLVLRRSKPKNGNWKEVEAYECCNDVTLTFTVSSPIITDVVLRLFCNGTVVNYLYTPSDSTSMITLQNILNQSFNVLGTFSNPSGNIIKLAMSSKQKEAICPVGTLTFDVIAD